MLNAIRKVEKHHQQTVCKLTGVAGDQYSSLCVCMTKEEILPDNSQISQAACQFTVVTGSLYRTEQKPGSSCNEYPHHKTKKLQFAFFSVKSSMREGMERLVLTLNSLSTGHNPNGFSSQSLILLNPSHKKHFLTVCLT